MQKSLNTIDSDERNLNMIIYGMEEEELNIAGNEGDKTLVTDVAKC